MITTNDLNKKKKNQPTFEQIRKQIMKFVSTQEDNEKETRKFFFIITALRGPDTYESETNCIKLSTTAIIRRKFGWNPDNYNGGFTVAADDSQYNADLRKKLTEDYNFMMEQVGSHFYTHAKNAFEALGLSWTEVNKLD